MATAYSQETILITNSQTPHTLSKSLWWYLNCEADNIYAEITVEHAKMLFTVDGTDPYSSHCMFGLQYCNYARPGDSIKLETWMEIAQFKAIKDGENNCTITIIYYKGYP